MSLLIREIPGTASNQKANEFVPMKWHERKQPRRKYVTDKGTEVDLALPRGTILSDGMIIYANDQTIIAVKAESEPVLVIRPIDHLQTCIAAHNLGNWHRSMQVTADGELIAEEDGPLRERLQKINIPFTSETRVFQPTLAVSAHD
jgi:urease accessory protein